MGRTHKIRGGIKQVNDRSNSYLDISFSCLKVGDISFSCLKEGDQRKGEGERREGGGRRERRGGRKEKGEGERRKGREKGERRKVPPCPPPQIKVDKDW